MDKNIIDEINMELEEIKKNGLYRSLKEVSGSNSSHLFINGKEALNFCSNNYLGITTHKEVISYGAQALKEYGTGAGASRLISGNLTIHTKLEQKIANLLNYESALLFPTGYQANLGIITSLVNKDDVIFCDKLCHASVIDGIILSRAKFFRYHHKNIENLENLLYEHGAKFRRKLIITESVFSMDGDIAPLKELAGLAEKFNAFLLIDEAHAFGVIGENGGGAHELLGLKPHDYIIIMGTLGKSLGCAGAFAASCKNLREYFINKARSFIFTTGLSPVNSASAFKALEVINEFPALRKKLIKNAQYFRDELKKMGFNCLESETQIIPILIGDNHKTILFSNLLLENNIYIQAIRPPTVPQNTARLRISLMTTHTQKDIGQCLDILSNIGKKLGII